MKSLSANSAMAVQFVKHGINFLLVIEYSGFMHWLWRKQGNIVTISVSNPHQDVKERKKTKGKGVPEVGEGMGVSVHSHLTASAFAVGFVFDLSVNTLVELKFHCLKLKSSWVQF